MKNEFSKLKFRTLEVKNISPFKQENKYLDFQLEIKEVKEDGTFSGYASVFGVEDFGGDIVAAGAFTRTIKDWTAKKVKLPILWQHNPNIPVGFYTLLKEDNVGLYVEGHLDLDIQEGRDAYSRLKKGYVSGLSIGYSSRKSDYDETSGVRTLLDVDLFEISLVTFPMNDEARTQAVKRSEKQLLPKTVKEFEKLLREVGFSKSHSKVIANHGMAELIRREVGSNDKANQEILDSLKNLTIPTIG